MVSMADQTAEPVVREWEPGLPSIAIILALQWEHNALVKAYIALRAEVSRETGQRKLAEELQSLDDELTQQLQAAEARCAALVKALEFYASPDNYMASETYAPNGRFIGGPTRIDEDVGDIARAALKERT